MPLYTITTQADILSAEAKATLARDITAFHAEYAGIPEDWVQIVFQDYAAGSGFTGGKVSTVAALMLQIRTGRSAEYKSGMVRRLGDLLQQATRLSEKLIIVGINEVPPSQAMEMGMIMPEVATT